MANLTENEIRILTQYRLGTEKDCPNLLIEGNHLLDSSRLQNVFEELSTKLNTSKVNVIGSMFVKRYAFLTALALYSMSVFNKALNTDLSNITLRLDPEDPLCLPSFHFQDLVIKDPSDDRHTWRDGVIRTLFKENVSRVIAAISAHTHVSRSVLWENVAIYIFWMYETLLDKEENSDVYEKLLQDFIYVVKEAPGALFGPFSTNPLTKYYHPKELEELTGQLIRKRSTCCLYYLMSDKQERCGTCPVQCIKENKKLGQAN
ncbi:IucA/IucC family C-terminal-domain containing protein [Metabacillus herbersteinensis]|uniref:IucA/IucC family C-terminal-domain containing protein n=1 Tax=Metabacillus herbersteinensis TaxID=283816 RepID=A0ABV6GBM1_9BACI